MTMRGKDFTTYDTTGLADLDALLHPAQAFDHPDDVANDPDLSLNEKRAILASWASDACAVEAAPALRCAPGGKRAVTFDEVMDALRKLDQEAQQQEVRTHDRGASWRLARWRKTGRARNDGSGPCH